MKLRNRTYGKTNQETQTPIIKKTLTLTVPEYLAFEVVKFAQELVSKDIIYSRIGGKEKEEMYKELLVQMLTEQDNITKSIYIV